MTHTELNRINEAKFKFEYLLLMLSCGRTEEAQKAAYEVLTLLQDLVDSPVG